MKHLFIINPAAGSRDRTKQYSVAIHEACTLRDLDYRIEVSSAPGECYRIAREAAETGDEYRIYACGGIDNEKMFHRNPSFYFFRLWLSVNI